METIARWESKGGKYWVEVYDNSGMSYRSNSAGGSLGNWDQKKAIEYISMRISRGEFQADANVTPMTRVC